MSNFLPCCNLLFTMSSSLTMTICRKIGWAERAQRCPLYVNSVNYIYLRNYQVSLSEEIQHDNCFHQIETRKKNPSIWSSDFFRVCIRCENLLCSIYLSHLKYFLYWPYFTGIWICWICLALPAASFLQNCSRISSTWRLHHSFL